jgi:hypothetical protein
MGLPNIHEYFMRSLSLQYSRASTFLLSCITVSGSSCLESDRNTPQVHTYTWISATSFRNRTWRPHRRAAYIHRLKDVKPIFSHVLCHLGRFTPDPVSMTTTAWLIVPNRLTQFSFNLYRWILSLFINRFDEICPYDKFLVPLAFHSGTEASYSVLH